MYRLLDLKREPNMEDNKFEVEIEAGEELNRLTRVLAIKIKYPTQNPTWERTIITSTTNLPSGPQTVKPRSPKELIGEELVKE